VRDRRPTVVQCPGPTPTMRAWMHAEDDNDNNNEQGSICRGDGGHVLVTEF